MDRKDIDESLYSRQLYVLGRDAMKQMAQSDVLLCGLGGLGVEIAKNIILSGVRSVCLYDIKNVTIEDMSTQYYLSEKDIGKNRAQASLDKLRELNSYVKVNYYDGNITEDFIKTFKVVILTDSPLNQQIKINNITHENNIAFINTCTIGLSGQIFCDFGNEFIVNDTDGEQPLSSTIEFITNEKQAIIKCIDSKPHGLTTGDLVKFSVSGMTELNELQYVKIQYVDRLTFKIDVDTSNYSQCTGGDFIQVKLPKILKFKRLQDALKSPEFTHTNFLDFDRPSILHACYLSYELFKDAGKTVTLDNQAEFIELVNKQFNTTDIKTVEKFIWCIDGELIPVNSVVGGVVAQEILKACSGKFTPIYQYSYFDFFNCLSDDYKSVETKVTGTRYDKQIKIFGQDIQKKIGALKYLIVGAGAIGCELLKNFTMMGVSTSDGKIYLTDMDTIEKSNLSRQFLFRNEHIGKSKSDVASKVVKDMNPEVNIEAHLNRMGPETEHVYNGKFFDSLDGVANALDNIPARLYVDGRCVLFNKSLLESGTLGTKGNVQVVVPHVTESYGVSQDPPEQSVPVCTIKNFPNAIEHCIQFSRDQFEGIFDQDIRNTLNYINDPEKIKKLSTSELITISNSIKTVITDAPKTFDDCINRAFNMWYNCYRDQIVQLLEKFPPDHRTSSDAPFWSAGKKCPTPLKFDINNNLHTDYIFACANIYANIYSIKDIKSRTYVNEYVATLKEPKLSIDNSIEISATDEEEKEKEKKKNEISYNIEDIKNSLPHISQYEGLKLVPQSFEKDDDTNYHIDFITASSNLRATNYGIPCADRLKTKGIAGKIIPALATTTAVVAGYVCLELYKLVQKFTNIERYNNTFVNLALPMFASSEPIVAKVTKYKDMKFTQWDNFELYNTTLQNLLDHFENKYNLEIEFVNYGGFMLYSPFISPKKLTKRLNTNIKEIIEQELNITISTDIILLTIGISSDEDEDIDIPQIKLRF